MSTTELLHAPNPSGQRGIWAHSQDVSQDLLKRYVVQVRRTGWLGMRSFDSATEAAEYAVSSRLKSYFSGPFTARIWDDKLGVTVDSVAPVAPSTPAPSAPSAATELDLKTEALARSLYTLAYGEWPGEWPAAEVATNYRDDAGFVIRLLPHLLTLNELTRMELL